MSKNVDGIDLTAGLEEQSYDYKDELEIRKILEAHTNWQFEFTKNDQYAYDLRITEWDSQPRSPDDNRTLGFVELERSRSDKDDSWVTGEIPDSWYFYSFLMRKVRKWNPHTQRFGGLKDEFRRTIYLKFNHAMDNCFAAAVADIYHHGQRTPWSDGTKENTYLKLDLSNPAVTVGIEESVGFIESYLSNYSNGQRTVFEWSNPEEVEP
jgi:hypothetical protein